MCVCLCVFVSPRTARGFDYGTALSLVSEDEEEKLAAVEERLHREAAGEP